MRVSAIDLFSGAGGLTRGLLDSNHDNVDISVEAGFDLDEDSKYPYEANNEGAEFVQADLATLIRDREDYLGKGMDEEEVDELDFLTSPSVGKYFDDTADATLLAGCAPCQPFSALSRGDTESHDKWELLHAFEKLVVDLEPDLVTMENVPRLASQDIYEDFISSLRSEGYHVDAGILYCPDYGIPQTRKRLVLLASKEGDITLPEPTHSEDEHKSVMEQIGGLPEIEAGEQDEEDPLHKARNIIDRNIRRWHASEPGGTWRDWPSELVLACHQKESGRSYDNVYGIMEPNKPSPTITTKFYNFGTGRFGHPEQPRPISLREGALLQTFPSDYEFVKNDEDITFQNIGRLIGNAVPVKLGEVIGEAIQKHLESQMKPEQSAEVTAD